MKLGKSVIENRKEWEEKGYRLPEYDRKAMIQKTKERPAWIHFGAGNIFRAFHANIAERLLNSRVIDTGIIVAEGFDYEIVEKMYRPNEEYSILVTLKADGNVEKMVVGSIAESCILDSENADEFERLKEIFRKDSLQLATFTITEKGYSLLNGQGKLLQEVISDYQKGPGKPESYIGKVTSLLYERYLAGKKPIAMVSTDNCSHNGDKLYAAVNAFAEKWEENGFAEKGFSDYIQDKKQVSFPWSMIDKITPRPDTAVAKMLKTDRLEGLEPVVTSENTYVAPFVNAEECEYLVIEDEFPNGRPHFEKAGLMFTDKATVDKVEKMKVCTCLNPLHTALAIYGCLLGYTKISEEMKDTELKKLIEMIGYQEGLPVVINPGLLDPRKFLDTVINIRIPNPFMPDTPQRIATDTSQKLAIRFGETVSAYQKSNILNVSALRGIPLVLAGWLRYLMAVDDAGNSFVLSPDPMLEKVCPYLADIRLGEPINIHEKVKDLLSNQEIFGVNLYEAGLGGAVEGYFCELTASKGAVRETLKKYTG